MNIIYSLRLLAQRQHRAVPHMKDSHGFRPFFNPEDDAVRLVNVMAEFFSQKAGLRCDRTMGWKEGEAFQLHLPLPFTISRRSLVSVWRCIPPQRPHEQVPLV